MNSRTLAIDIDRAVQDVYEFVTDPRMLPRWAPTFCKSVNNVGGAWVISTPEGDVRIRFVPRNELGVADHYVSPKPGVEMYVPMRVVPNGQGAEVMLTIFQHPGMSDADFGRDIDWVSRDLAMLKKVLESIAAA